MNNTSKTDWDRVRNMTEEEIQRNAESDPDALPTDEAFWENARVVMPSGEVKALISIRVDQEVLDFFKKTGKGYQKRINAVLKSFVEAQHRQAS